MNVKESLDILMSRLGNRTDPDLRLKCLSEMKLAQEALEASETLPWFILSESATAKTKAPDGMLFERRLRLPADFIREADDEMLVTIEVDGQKRDLEKHPYDELYAHYGEQVGPPEAYAVRGEYLMFFPKPDAEYTIEMSSYYSRQQAPIDSDSTPNAWFKHVPDLLIARAGVVVSTMHLKDAELAAVFAGYQKEAERRLFHLEVAREEANRQREMED